MPRRLVMLSLAILGLHVFVALYLGSSSAGSLAGNSLQIFASALAVATAFSATRRASGMARPFWLLVGCAMATWGVANLGWTYYEAVLHIEPPTGSLVRFLFDTQGVFFAMALFLDQDKDLPQIDPESVLDFIQIAIVFFFIFFGVYYLPSLYTDARTSLVRELQMGVGEDAVLVGLALVQAMRARVPHLRKLYFGLTIYLAVYTLGALVNDYQQLMVETTPTGTFYDLAWTVPLLFGAVWAASWRQGGETRQALRARPKTFGAMLVTNTLFAVAPLIILLQVAQLGSEWRLLRFSLLGVSILCFAARLGLSEAQQARSAVDVRRQGLALDSSVDGMAMLSAQGEYIYVNATFARMLGHRSPSDMMGKTWRELANHQDGPRLESEIREALQRDGKWFGPVTIRRDDHSTFAMEMAITLLPDGGTVCVSRDVTDRRELELARAHMEMKYRALVEQVTAISYIAELGVQGAWLYVSPQVEQIFGYTAEEWLAGSGGWMSHVPEEDRPAVLAAEEASDRGEPFQAEYRVIRKDGRVVWVSDTAVVVKGSDSHPVMEGIIIDITDRKILENQLQQSRRMEAVGRLAGGIAHDFNNLLTIIKGYADLAINRPGTPASLSSDVQHINSAAERASELVRQLLAFSRKQVLQPKSIDLNDIVLGLDHMLRRLMGEDIEMLTHCQANVGIVKADPAQIEQVVMNLVVNARDAMPDGGRLTIETADVELDANYARDHATVRPGRYVMLAVSDNGIGMDAETRAHIFEPFFTTKGGTRGTGLGLSTVYGIVKQSGGYIWVYSEPGSGTTFKVYLPRVEALAEPKPGIPEVRAASKGTETILLVEDEEGVRELCRIALEEQGYSLVVAENTKHALQLAGDFAGDIHLLLTDVVMPVMSGREMAKLISARNPKIRILYMSGYTDNVIDQGGILERGVYFLQKPFTGRTLASKVREVLDAPVAVKP